jgi:hypothetical protein
MVGFEANLNKNHMCVSAGNGRSFMRVLQKQKGEAKGKRRSTDTHSYEVLN